MKATVRFTESDYRVLTDELAAGAVDSNRVKVTAILTKGDYELRIEAEVWIKYGFNCEILSYSETRPSDFDKGEMERRVRLFL